MYMKDKNQLFLKSMKMTGGGNKDKGIPPTATHSFGLNLRSTRAKANMTMTGLPRK